MQNQMWSAQSGIIVCLASAITPSISSLLRCKHAVWFIVEWTQWRVTSHWMLMCQSLTLHTNVFPLTLLPTHSRTISLSILLCLSFLVCTHFPVLSVTLTFFPFLSWRTRHSWQIVGPRLCFLHSGIVWVVKTTRKLGKASGFNVFLCSSYFFLFFSAPIVVRARNSHGAPVLKWGHTPGFQPGLIWRGHAVTAVWG